MGMMMDSERLEELTAELDNIGVFGSPEEYEPILAQLPPESDLAYELAATIDARRGVYRQDMGADPRYIEMWDTTVGALGLPHRRH